MKDRTEKKEKKKVKRQARREKNSKARAKHYFKEGGLSAATSVVSVIVYVRKLVY